MVQTASLLRVQAAPDVAWLKPDSKLHQTYTTYASSLNACTVQRIEHCICASLSACTVQRIEHCVCASLNACTVQTVDVCYLQIYQLSAADPGSPEGWVCLQCALIC